MSDNLPVNTSLKTDEADFTAQREAIYHETIRALIRERVTLFDAAGPPDIHTSLYLAHISVHIGDLSRAAILESEAIYEDHDREAARDHRKELRGAALRVGAFALALAEHIAAHTCRACGCTDDFACPGGCLWIEPGLCSNCRKPIAAERPTSS